MFTLIRKNIFQIVTVEIYCKNVPSKKEDSQHKRVEKREILSLSHTIFDKNFVKVPFLRKKLSTY